jgi:dienelactone hydrolase
MRIIFLTTLLALIPLHLFAQDESITAFEGIRIKNGHKAEALYYYNNNWEKLRAAAVNKGFIESYSLVETIDPKRAQIDIGLLTHFANKKQFEKREENFASLISAQGKLKLLNELKPSEFRESVVVSTMKGDFFAIPAIRGGAFFERRVKLENEGWELHGDLIIPLSKRNVPAVIMLNKAFGDRAAYKNLAGKLAKSGIASLRIDLRAHGESVNKGRFGPPFDEKMRSLLKGSAKDISATYSWLKARKEIDPTRIGFIGASYSGEEMVAAARDSGYGKTYVALSPGSFSKESMESIDQTGVPWFFVKSVGEIALMNNVFKEIRNASKSARLLEVSGKKHASDILLDKPDVEDLIVLWFKHNL